LKVKKKKQIGIKGHFYTFTMIFFVIRISAKDKFGILPNIENNKQLKSTLKRPKYP
jgi:hypothetical protein